MTDMNEPSHRVTITDIYRQAEDNKAMLSAIQNHVSVLLDRSDDRDKDVAKLSNHVDSVEDKLDTRISRLEKIVYWAGIPIGLVATGTLGWNFLSPLF